MFSCCCAHPSVIYVIKSNEVLLYVQIQTHRHTPSTSCQQRRRLMNRLRASVHLKCACGWRKTVKSRLSYLLFPLFPRHTSTLRHIKPKLLPFQRGETSRYSKEKKKIFCFSFFFFLLLSDSIKEQKMGGERRRGRREKRGIMWRLDVRLQPWRVEKHTHISFMHNPHKQTSFPNPW